MTIQVPPVQSGAVDGHPAVLSTEETGTQQTPWAQTWGLYVKTDAIHIHMNAGLHF